MYGTFFAPSRYRKQENNGFLPLHSSPHWLKLSGILVHHMALGLAQKHLEELALQETGQDRPVVLSIPEVEFVMTKTGI